VSAPLVVCVGLCVVDLILAVDRVPQTAGKFFADASVESPGGPAATAAAAIARLGGRARFVGRLGGDTRGDRIVSVLEAAGVEVDVERLADLSSPVSAVLVTPDGERTIVNHTDARLFATPPPATAFAGADAVLADARWPLGAVAAMDRAAASGVPGILDLDLVPAADVDAFWPAVHAATHVVASAPGLAALVPGSGESDGESLASMTGGWVAVTAGSEGVHWAGGHLAPPGVRAVETLGAGDVFHGAFALALVEGSSKEHALRFASAAAAVRCSRTGGWSALANRTEVELLMEETWSPQQDSSGG